MKRDALGICNYIDRLRKAQWLGRNRSWWPNYIYHTTDLHNVVSILEDGLIYSRARATVLNSLKVDIADDSVIEGTRDEFKEFVRFYFRPKTPTLFINEGVRPRERISNNAHCPVPVTLMFNAKKILVQSGVLFSNGNIGKSTVETGDDVDFLEQIPFEAVYHDSWFSPEERERIIFHRHAEVLVPNEINLSALEFVRCRSTAELETLRFLLSPSIFDKWKMKIGKGARFPVFNQCWNYVDTVECIENKIVITFNLHNDRECQGPFDFEYRVYRTGKLFRKKVRDSYYLPRVYRINAKILEESFVIFELLLDGNTVYKNTLFISEDGEAPF